MGRKDGLVGTSLLSVLLMLTACSSTRNQLGIKKEDTKKIISTVHEIDVSLPNHQSAKLGAELWRPHTDFAPKTVIIMVPGSGATSRRGAQGGNGIVGYDAPVEVNVLWANALAQEGMWVLSYDKRSCTPAHDRICKSNPVSDLDVEGPKGLRRDVDAACDFAKNELGNNVRIVLWTSSQGTQVVLSSQCKDEASALVFVSPVTERIDRFWVDSLFHAGRTAKDPALRAALDRKARNLQATFESIEQGLFAKDAKIMGVTLQFWKEWIALTGQTQPLFSTTKAPMLFLVGEKDALYSDKARNTLKKLTNRGERRLLVVNDADQHLLREGVLSAHTAKQAFRALVKVLQGE